MTSRIRFKHYALRIKVVDWEAKVVAKSDVGDDARFFLRAWRQMQKDYRAPLVEWTPRDEVITQRLLAKHGLDSLQKAAIEFWRRHARDMGVFDGRKDQIVLFASACKTTLLES